jgi:hypothetical protein
MYCSRLVSQSRVHSSIIANAVLAKIKEDFPCLAPYENNWVTIDFIKLVLRKTVAEHRKTLKKKVGI